MEHPGQEAHAMRDTAAHVNATNIDDLSLSFVQSIIVDDQASKDPHAEVSSGLFSKLPNELFDLILDSITDPIDKLCLALTCKSMWVDLKPVKKIPLSQEYESEDHKVSTLGCRFVRHVDYICCADSNVYRCGWSNNYTGELSVQWVEGHSGGWAGTSLTYHPHYQRSKERDCFVNKKDLLKLAALQEYGWTRYPWFSYYDLLKSRMQASIDRVLRILGGGLQIQNGADPVKIHSVDTVLNVKNGFGINPKGVSRSTVNVAEAILIAEVVAAIYAKEPSIIDKWGILTVTSLYAKQVLEIKKQLISKNRALRNIRVIHLQADQGNKLNNIKDIQRRDTDILIHSASRTTGPYGILNESKQRFTNYIEKQSRFMRIVVCDEPYWHCSDPSSSRSTWRNFIRQERLEGHVTDVKVFGAPELPDTDTSKFAEE